MPDTRESTNSWTETAVQDFTARLLAPTKRWVTLVAVAALLSCVEFTRNTSGNGSLSFRMSAITVTCIVAVWLPGLIRLVALAGGGIKTGLGEATSPGITALLAAMTPEAKSRSIPPLVAALRVSEASFSAEQERSSQDARATLEAQLSTVIASDASSGRNVLDEQANDYESTRTQMGPGIERTMKMEQSMAIARAAARRARLPAQEVLSRFDDGTDGKRITALAALQVRPQPESLANVQSAIQHPRSQFEQYHALVAARALVSSLDAAQRAELHGAVSGVLADGEARIDPMSDRYPLASALLADLRPAAQA